MWRGDELGRRVRGPAAVRSRVEVAVRRYAPGADWGLWALAVLAAAAVLVTLSLAGCSRGSRAAGGPEEIRLTGDGVWKSTLRFSPDGRWLAYTGRVEGAGQEPGIFVVARQGGKPRRVTPDSLGLYGVAWAGDGKGLYCRATGSDSIYYAALDGALRVIGRAEMFTRFVGMSPDGRTELLLQFNGDNRDLAMRRQGGKAEVVAATPVWEEDAVFGPRPGDITVVAFPTYQAPTSKIAVWSAREKSFTDLPLPEGINSNPAWTADGRYLAFVSYDGNQSDVWVYDAQAARAAALTTDPADAGSPSWSPDGEWLAFTRHKKSSHLYIGNPTKHDIRPLTEGAARDYLPSMSRDGKWVAFARRPAAGAGASATGGGPAVGPKLCVMSLPQGPVTEFDLGGVTLAGKDADCLSWSADGRHLAFQGSDGSGKLDIYRIGRDGKGLARVTVSPGEELAPVWSPDGSRIAYVQVGGGAVRVFAVPATGGVAQEVSHVGVQSEGSVWAPDSDRLAYVAYRPEGGFDIWVRSLSRPQERRLVIGDKDVVWPIFWSRDGRDLILVRMEGGKYAFSAYELATGKEVRIGRSTPLPSGRGDYPDLNAQGEKYRDLFYPGGEAVFADGKDTSDIYLVKARGLLEARLLAALAE